MLNHKKIEKIFLIILEGLIYISFLMPFILLNKSIFPFIVGKILFFQGTVQLMAIFYIFLLALNFKKYLPKKTLLLYWFGFYAISLLVSGVFGVDFQRSFWSNFERMTGIFVIFHCILYSIIISIVFDDWKKIKRAIQVLLGVSLLQVGVIAAQYLKEGVFLYANKGGRVWGSLGNSIYVGSYFIFHIFFALLLAFKEKKQIWQIIYMSIAILEAVIIIHSRSSRGADMALIFGLLVIIFGYAFLSKNKKIRNVGIIIFILGCLTFGGLVAFRNAPQVKNIPAIGNLVNISLKEGTGRTRAIAWGIAWKAFKEKPVVGYGLENFYYVFNKHYNPESLKYSYYETWFDRSHSIVFDALALGGLIGFIAYFGLFAVGGVSLAVLWRKGIVDKHILIFFFIIFSTYIIQNLFVFDHPASYFLLYFSFGLLLGILSRGRGSAEPKYNFTYFSFSVIATIVVTVFLSVFFITTIRTHKAAIEIINAERIFVSNPKIGLQKYREVMEMKTPFLSDMRSLLAKRAAKINIVNIEKVPELKEILLFSREEFLKKHEEGQNKDVYDFLILGQIDTLLGNVDPKYLDSAEDFFAKARELSPKRQQIYYVWGKTKIIKNDLAGAQELLEEALSFDENIPDSHWYLSLLYEKQGKYELAWESVKRAIEKLYVWKNLNEIYFAISLGEKFEDDKTLVKLYLWAIERNEDAKLYLSLGKVYHRLGDNRKATEALIKAKKINPELFK